MPQALESFLGYLIYFWYEAGEPIHVHVSKGKPQKGATKIWITQDGAEIAHNKSKIPERDLKRILRYVSSNKNRIIAEWVLRNGSGSVKR
ncbi:DUF4160 domain-containing protein [uncultured Anaerovibrio sp.]|jgi:hypothetical protein|uniref:DUF4160 domain-containing protein n=1 Tax=uncultured Anaerovibrio sp. TaxID=361586 RepID=UPI0026386EB7|nr:DUF4160 domain-containing protein [uncultured Anaerovibrio sp.]